MTGDVETHGKFAGRPARFLVLVPIFLAAQTAATTLAARIDFNDLAPGSIAGQFGGAGFSPTDAWGNSTLINVIAEDLVASPDTNFALNQSAAAQSVQSTSPSPHQSTRGLASPLGGAIWFSFLLLQPDAAARGGLSFNTNSTSAAVVPRVVAVGTNVFIDYGADAQDLYLNNVLTIGQPVLFLGRIELDAVASSLDRLSLWIDPDVADLGPPDAVLDTNDAFGDSITRIGLISYHSNGTVGGRLDLVSVANGPEAYLQCTGQPGPDYELTFSDAFDQPALDASTWVLDPVRSNVEVSAGLLRLLTTRAGDDWLTGKVSSYFTQRFGYYESRYRIGGDAGLNNAFWLTTPDDVVYESSGTPQSIDRTEVDINETHYPDELNMTLHDWAPVHVGVKHASAHVGGDLSQEFHTYAFEWRADNSMTWYFDGAPYMSATPAEVNSVRTALPLAVLFSTLVAPFAGPPGPNLDGTSMDIDYVRVYRRPGWSGNAGGSWEDPNNWGLDGVPMIDGAAVFNQPTPNATVTLAADVSLREIYFEGADTAAMTLAAGHTMTLGDISSPSGVSGITLNTDVVADQTIDLDLVGIRDFIIANYSRQGATLHLNGSINALAPGRLLHFGGGAIVVSGSIGSNIADLVNFAGAKTCLAAANSHTGTTDVRGGVLTVAANGALGVATSDAPTRIARGASLALTNAVQYVDPEPLYLAGASATGVDGALTVADASSVTWNAGIWLSADAAISSGPHGGALVLNGPVNTPDATTRELTLTGAGTVELHGTLGTRISGLRKIGPGTAVLSGTNFHGGVTTVEDGILALAAPGATGPSVLIDVQTGGFLDVTALAPSVAYTINSGRTLHADGQVIGNLTITSNGTLEGRGTLAGNVILEPGCTLRIDAPLPSANAAASAGLSAGQATVSNATQPLRIVSGSLSCPTANTLNLEITDPPIGPGVYVALDWRGASAIDVQAADFDLTTFIQDAQLVIADDRLLLAVLTDEDRFDFDADGDIDAADATVFLMAMTGPADSAIPPSVTLEQFVRADFNSDGHVDLVDFADFARAFATSSD